MTYFTARDQFLLVPLDTNDEEFRKLVFLLEILEDSGVGKIIEKAGYKSSDKGRQSHDVYNLFATIVFCFAMRSGSLREIEELCRYDVRAMYLMNWKVPSYKTVSEFISDVVVPNAERIFACVNKELFRRIGLDTSDQYIDGTKIEANANKYKFVWKPRKRHEKLDQKVRIFMEKVGFPVRRGKGFVKSEVLFKATQGYREATGIGGRVIAGGKGKRLSAEERLVREGDRLLQKLLEYEEQEAICGPGRNSYFKTDHDATAMALKEDYYSGHGSNMHAAYNIQFLVAGGFVTMYGVFQDRADYYTFIPMLKRYRQHYRRYPTNICADSGYGVLANYEYVSKHGIGNYIKPLSWNGESSGKRPQMFFPSDDGDILCRNGIVAEKMERNGNTHQRQKGAKLYIFRGCADCGYAWKCKQQKKDKTEDFRTIELSYSLEVFKETARRNLLSRKGIEIRVNRSIQSEGTYGQLKNNMNYIRIRRRGIAKVGAEIMLMSLGMNIRKMFHWFGSSDKVKAKFWLVSDDTKDEEFPVPKQK